MLNETTGDTELLGEQLIGGAKDLFAIVENGSQLGAVALQGGKDLAQAVFHLGGICLLLTGLVGEELDLAVVALAKVKRATGAEGNVNGFHIVKRRGDVHRWQLFVGVQAENQLQRSD